MASALARWESIISRDRKMRGRNDTVVGMVGGSGFMARRGCKSVQKM